jgi:Zn-dependent peptidase ImmA (M78 family)
MIWVTDKTGRFPQRPHYKPEELDFECQELVCGLLKYKYGTVKFPLSTDDLTVLIERDTSNLDLYADLSQDGADIEGATDFYENKDPVVLIKKELSEEPWQEHRLRTTLSHEYGHVKLHAFLWGTYRPKLIPSPGWEKGPRCKRSTILTSAKKDWLEWQASYASGALLIPKTYLRQIAGDFLKEQGCYGSVMTGSSDAAVLIQRVADCFDVSRDAAKVRLSQQGYLSQEHPTIPLFS